MVPVPAHLHANLHNVAPCAGIGITVQLAKTAKQLQESACAVVAMDRVLRVEHAKTAVRSDSVAVPAVVAYLRAAAWKQLQAVSNSC